MLNEYVAVGHITHISKIDQDGKKVKLNLAIARSEKNANGEYETDYLPFYLKDNLAETALEYCQKGDTVGIKASIEKRGRDIVIIGRRLSLLSPRKEGE